VIRHLIGAAFVSVALWASTSCGSSTGRVAYSAVDMSSGHSVSLGALRGSPVVLVSWTTWCTECDAELQQLHDFVGSSAATGIEVVAVNLDAADNSAEIDAKIERHDLSTRLWRDRHNEFKRAFGAIGVPTTVVVDAGGTVVGVFPGAVDFHDAAIVAALDKVRAGRV
jgi:peroxiredoxin